MGSKNEVTVLSIGPWDEHQVALAEIFSCAVCSALPDAKANLELCSSLPMTPHELGNRGIPIVLCDGDSESPDWKDMLRDLAQLPAAPAFILTSRLADQRLWAEALRLGAYDVLAKPFNAADVVRVVTGAWQYWRERHGVPSKTSSTAGRRRTRGNGRMPAAV